MLKPLLVLLVIVLAVAIRGRRQDAFYVIAPWVGSCDHLRRKMGAKNSDDNKLK